MKDYHDNLDVEFYITMTVIMLAVAVACEIVTWLVREGVNNV